MSLGGEQVAGAWVVLGAPLDSAAAGEGEERAPEALRATGLIGRIGARDLGDVTGPLRPPERDQRTGIVAFEALVEASAAIAASVAAVIESFGHPLILGGDCSLLIGAIAGARRAGRDPGLLFVDGHADYWDGDSSPTGESADMELAILHGDGPAELAEPDDSPASAGPLVEPGRTAILGHRPPGLHPDVAAERERVPSEVLQLDAAAIGEVGPAASAERALERVGHDPWLHLDLDALDAAALPAVSYPLGDGLGWDQLEALLAPMIAAGVLGVSVADLNSDLDPHGAYATRVAELLQRIMIPA